MKTDDLINALVADLPARPVRLIRIFAGALVAGIAVSLLVCMLWIPPRPDFAQAAFSIRVLVKFIVASSLSVAALGLLTRLVRPGAPNGFWGYLWMAAPLMLIFAVALELYVVPPDLWRAKLIGVNARYCVALVPLLSLGPLAGILFALREGAPTRLRLTGAVAGLAAGGIAATLYASHCTDDSPLFFACWYSLAIGIVVALGAWLGPRLLRW